MEELTMEELEKRVQENPADDKAWFEMGKRYFNTDFKKARDCFSMAIAVDPFNAEYRHNRGRKALSLDQFEEAFADISMGVRLDVNDGHKWHYLANCYFFLGRYEEAIECYKTAIKYHKRNGIALEAPAIDWIWMAYMKLGKKEEAEKFVKENTYADMPVVDSDLSYKKRILLYAGLTTIDEFLEKVVNYDDDLDAITEVYGAVNYYKYIDVDLAKASEYCDKVLSYPTYHNAFAYKHALMDRKAFDKEDK